MIDVDVWVPRALELLREAFGARLLYLGLQGSYRRGEATETSDIDLVTLFDAVSLADLDAYRRIIHALPEGEKACGFLCDADTFARWPRHELFPFAQDTRDYHGKLADYLPPIAREDIIANARIGASGLLHVLTHSYLYAPQESRPEILKGCYKSAYFAMQVTHYLSSGSYCTDKGTLMREVDGAEREIIVAGRDFAGWLAAHSEEQAFTMLLDWCRAVI